MTLPHPLVRVVVLFVLALGTVGAALPPANAAPKPATVRKPGLLLAADGKALAPIVISKEASPATRAVAEELAQYLQRISGASFSVQTGDGSRGIVLGTLAQFPDPAL